MRGEKSQEREEKKSRGEKKMEEEIKDREYALILQTQQGGGGVKKDEYVCILNLGGEGLGAKMYGPMGMCTQTEGGRGKMDEYGQFCILKTGERGSKKFEYQCMVPGEGKKYRVREKDGEQRKKWTERERRQMRGEKKWWKEEKDGWRREQKPKG